MLFFPLLLLDLSKKGYVFRMARKLSHHFSSYGAVQEIEITDEIQDLMTDEFVRKPQFSIDDFFIIQQNEVVKPASSTHSHSFKHLYILEEPEGSCRSDLVSKSLLALEGELEGLFSNGGWIVEEIAD